MARPGSWFRCCLKVCGTKQAAVTTLILGLTTGFVLFLVDSGVWRGIEWIRRFLNWAGPFVYLVMIVLMIVPAVPGAARSV